MSQTAGMHPLLCELEELAMRVAARSAPLEAALESVLRALQCHVGTIHGLDMQSGLLSLLASRGVPEALLPRIQSIPIGKGMAGIAAQRRQPVQVCNLQTDDSGVAKPAAKETRMEGSIAVPILLDDQLHGTLGVAKPIPYEFSAAESELLLKAGAAIGRLISASSATQ
jgi:L-methionine (R)-S-oxide reductase